MKNRKIVAVCIIVICLMSGCTLDINNICPVSMDEYVLYNENEVKLIDLLKGEKVLYACADINGDSKEEIGFVSNGTLYLIELSDMKVIYEGVSYEHLVNKDGRFGLFYQRNGGAPKNIEYQFICFDEKNNANIECTWACYDDNQNDMFDGSDYYYFDDQKISYEEWNEKTAGYMNLLEGAEEWKELTINHN